MLLHARCGGGPDTSTARLRPVLGHSLAAELLQRGEDGGDAAITVMGHRLSGMTCFFLAEFLAAHSPPHLERRLSNLLTLSGPTFPTRNG